MPTRLATLTLRPARLLAETSTCPPETPSSGPSAPSPTSALVHKPLSAISRFGSTIFQRKVVATSTESQAMHKPSGKRTATSVVPLSPRRGATESNLLGSMPAGALTKLLPRQSRSARSVVVPLEASQPAIDLGTGSADSLKEDATRQPAELTSAPPLLEPQRPSNDHSSSSGSMTTTHAAPRRPILSKKLSANMLGMSGIVTGTSPLTQRGGSARSIGLFDRAKVESFPKVNAETRALEVEDSPHSSRHDSNHQSDPPVYTGQYVLDRFSAELTAFEKQEILSFPEVFYFSSMGVKRRRQHGRIVSPVAATATTEISASNEVVPIAATSDKISSDGEVTTTLSTTKTELFNDGYDDDRGDYVMLMQDHLAYRYEVLHALGSGSFGQVVCCLDHVTKTKVAVKVIRNRKRYKEQALIEIQVLTQLQQEARDRRHSSPHHVVQMMEHFVFRNHLCLTFELLGMNLYDYLKLRFFQGMPLTNIRVVTMQLLKALVHIRTKHIVHCDLKPENILIQAPLQCFAAGPGCSSVAFANVPVDTICLIDFGSSCLDTAAIYTYIQSRFYRSPEVILGHTYGTPIDMWSFGCILVELFTGHPIFAGENETEQLMCMMEILGVPASSYLAKCKRRKYFFHEVPVEMPTDETSKITEVPPATSCSNTTPAAAAVTYKPMAFTNSRGRRRVPGCRDLALVMKCEDASFVALVRKCFTWDPQDRLTPEAALLDPWLAVKEVRNPIND